MKKCLAVAGMSVFLLSGCVFSIDGNYDDDYDYGHGSSSFTKVERDNRQSISKLEAGDSLNMVRNKMGVPDFDELIVRDDREYRVLFYRTQRTKGDGVTTKDECTPILFENGNLVGFGETALDRI
jgi:hypothetical protein